MATLTPHLSLEEFHARYDGVKPYYEYWFGEAIQKPMATGVHGVLQFILMTFLSARGWFTGSEITLKISSELEFVPDVVASREKIRRSYPTTPVDICIEILSPEDRVRRAIEKGKHYLSWGVLHVWIIDPQSQTAYVLTKDHPEGAWIHPDGKLTAENTEISLTEIFAELDKRVA